MIKKGALLLGLAIAAAPAFAEPVRFDFEFVEPQGPARATGYIVFETTEIDNPGDNDIDLPSPAVLDLSVTVTGAEAGNGTFGLADFQGLVFDTNEGTLDFTQPLIGQPTAEEPWGTSTGEGVAGDFNLFLSGKGDGEDEGDRSTRYAPRERRGGGATPPEGVDFFTLGADGGSANEMVLVSMAPAGFVVPNVPVPVDSRWALAALLSLIAAAAFVTTRRRRVH